MRKIIFFTLVFLILIPFVKGDVSSEFNPQEIGYIEADLEIYSYIGSTSTLKELNYSLYTLPEEYYDLKIISAETPEISIKTDKYGNKKLILFWRNFYPQEYKIKMKVKNYAEFSGPQKIPFPYNPPKKYWDYLMESKYAKITDEIRDLSTNLTRNTKDSFDAITKISSWIHSNLEYDSSFSQETLPSDWVLENKRGTCDEFTNLFIAMVRSIGIPARYVSGVTYSKDGWGYHAWAEVYLDRWIPVDPTWNEIGWVDATHIKFGNFLDGEEIKVTAEYLSSAKTIMRITQPQVLVNLKRTAPIEKKFKTEIITYPKVIGIGDSAVVTVKVKTKSNGCLATTIKIVPRVDNSGNPIVSVYGERLFSLCPGETKEYHFIVESEKTLNKNYKYYNLADVYTFLGDTDVIDLEINPKETESSFLDLILDAQVVELGDEIHFKVNSDKEYKVFSDLPMEDEVIFANKTGTHYIIAVTETGDLIRRSITVKSYLDFKIMNIKKPEIVKCGDEFNISFTLESFKDNSFEVQVDTSKELDRVKNIELYLKKGEKKSLVLSSGVIENCTGQPQYLNIDVNGQKIFEKINVEKQKTPSDFLQIILDFLFSIFEKIISLIGR